MKLDTWIDEEVVVKVKKPVMQEDGSIKIEDSEIKSTQKTMYVDPPSRTAICARGKHSFRPLNTSQGLFVCSKCSYRRQVFPISYEFVDGQLRNRQTGELI